MLNFIPLAIVLLAFLVIVLLYLSSRIKVNNPYVEAAVFRLGKFVGIRKGGMFILGPFDSIQRVDVRTRVETFKGQELVTQDGLTLKIDFVLWCKVVDSEKALLSVADWWDAVSRAAETAMRDIVGQHDLPKLLSDRQTINSKIKALLDQTTEGWGVEAERVEIKDIDIPDAMQRAMAREAEAQREKTARIIKADGELEASKKLKEAADMLANSPQAFGIRQLQTISEVGAEKNSVIVIALPMEAMAGASGFAALAASKVHEQNAQG